MKTTHLLSLLATLAAASLAHGQAEAPGTIKATTTFRPDGTKANTVVDPEQHTSTETITDARDKVLRKTTYLLDEKSLAMAAIHYDANGTMRYKESYQRDAAGQLTEMRFTDPDGRYLGRRVFTLDGKTLRAEDYDAQGNLIPANKPAAGAARPDKKKK